MGRWPRIVSAAMTAAVGQFWLGWPWALAIIALIAVHELAASPQVHARWVLPRLESAPRAALAAYCATIAFGAISYSLLWGSIFAVGDVLTSFIAAAWLFGAVSHNQVYFSRRPELFIASMTPHVVTALATPFFMPELPWWGPWAFALMTVLALGNFANAMVDRNRLALSAEADRTARENAEQSSLAKTRFLATMSHELRTPLNAIIGYSEILEEDIADGAARAEDARRVQQAARHLLGLINEILDLSRIESGRMQLHRAPSDLAGMLHHSVETLRPLARANANDLSLCVENAIPVLLLDEGRVRQCVFNLISNACKFTRNGQVRVHASRVADIVTISVSDTGVGIAANAHERLFEPFEQVSALEASKTEGTGLGLAITRRLARAMGGDVALRSAPGEGSVFTLTFRAEAAPSRERAAA